MTVSNTSTWGPIQIYKMRNGIIKAKYKDEKALWTMWYLYCYTSVITGIISQCNKFNRIYCHMWQIIKGSGLDDWIYWPFFVQYLSLLRSIQRYHQFTHFPIHHCAHTRILRYPLVISWQQISTQKLSLQITIKSSCHFLFNHLGMPTLQNSTQFYFSLVVLNSALLCPHPCYKQTPII
jgi:hypothetical protein